MLKGIPPIISPDLMHIMMEMGHGDEIIFADGNFPAVSCAQRLIRCDGHDIPALLEAILPFFPLDSYVDFPVSLMEVTPGDPVETPIWDQYRQIISKENPNFRTFNKIERFEFYERAKKAFAIVATSEKALYANIMLKKGVVNDQ